VEVMTADDFLTRCEEIGVPKMTDLQVQCLMKVLGKPELSNAIRLNELEILMSNFTMPAQQAAEEKDRPATKQSREEKAEKKNKKRKQIAQLLEANPASLQALQNLLQTVPLADIETRITSVAYMQLVKSKNKQSEVSVVGKQELIQQLSLTADVIEPLEPVIYLNPKFTDIYQVKNVMYLMSDVNTRSAGADKNPPDRTF